jgi:hypothetical protein
MDNQMIGSPRETERSTTTVPLSDRSEPNSKPPVENLRGLTVKNEKTRTAKEPLRKM